MAPRIEGYSSKEERIFIELHIELHKAADACKHIIAEAAKERFGENNFPKMKFWVHHGQNMSLRSFEGITIPSCAFLQLHWADKEKIFLELRHRPSKNQVLVLRPSGLYEFDGINEKNCGLVHPTLGTEHEVSPIFMLILADEILNVINQTAQEKQKAEQAAVDGG